MIDDDFQVDEVDGGWLVQGAMLESEARMAVFEDLFERLTGSDERYLLDELSDLYQAHAVPGYWDVVELGTPWEAAVARKAIATTDRSGTFGWMLYVEDDE